MVRYAPSPTGRLHVGNLRTAWVSKCWADALGVPWVVRFEDIDTPRVVRGALEQQLEDLAALGLVPSRFYIQSERHQRHWEVLRRMIGSSAAYPCTCSRKEIREAIESSASAPHSAPAIYNGRCRQGPKEPDQALPSVAWRFRSGDSSGTQDVVIARTRSLMPDVETFAPAYALACAVDDLDGEYSLIVRAWDLAESADAQRQIQTWLLHSETPGTPRDLPRIFHASLITQNDGTRLEKRTRGVTLEELIKNGLSPKQILEKFADSFAPNLEEHSSQMISGEAEKTRTLASLGF